MEQLAWGGCEPDRSSSAFLPVGAHLGDFRRPQPGSPSSQALRLPTASLLDGCWEFNSGHLLK